MKKLVLFLLTSSAALAQAPPLEELIALARQGPAAPGLKDRIAKTLSARGGNAVWGQDYLFVSDSPAPVSISHRQSARRPHGPGRRLHPMDAAHQNAHRRHAFVSVLRRREAARRARRRGRLQSRFVRQARRARAARSARSSTIVSKIYDGMKSDYWVYASPGVDPAVPAALMVWQDGQGLVGDYSRSPPVHRHRKPGRAETAAAHRARDDRARPVARGPRHALHRIRHGERPLRRAS